MKNKRKNSGADLRKYYTIFTQIGLIVTLLIFIIAMNVNLKGEKGDINFTERQEIFQMEDIIQTEQVELPPPPPRPPVPVSVPNDVIIEDEILDINAEFDFNERLTLPPPPEEPEEEENFFVAVEQMPELIGGLAKLQSSIKYPSLARKAGIEGRVIVQFIVTEKGTVENPRVIRGIGGGADEEALRAVSNAQFIPGRQRGKAVRVQYSLPVIFKLQS